MKNMTKDDFLELFDTERVDFKTLLNIYWKAKARPNGLATYELELEAALNIIMNERDYNV